MVEIGYNLGMFTTGGRLCPYYKLARISCLLRLTLSHITSTALMSIFEQVEVVRPASEARARVDRCPCYPPRLYPQVYFLWAASLCFDLACLRNLPSL